MVPPEPAAATIAFLQREIEAVNAVRAPPVLDFLVERDVARASGADPRAPEELLVRESEDGLDVGLFLDREVLAAAAAAGAGAGAPRLLLRPGREGVAAVVEGVSHFVYLATRAAAGRAMSLLELELQAEVDAFAVLLLRGWTRRRRVTARLSGALRRRLFGAVSYLPHLDPESLERYRTANRLAGRYARWLARRFVGPGDRDGLLRELRATYRRGNADKAAYLATRT